MTLSQSRFEGNPIWRREMRERWRRPITLFFLTLYVVGFCWFGYSFYVALVVPNLQQQGAGLASSGRQLFLSLMGLQMCAWIPIAVLLAAPTVAVERERRSFIEYVLAGLGPHHLLRAKIASLGTFIVVMCAIPLPILALCLPMGGIEPIELVAAVLLEIALALGCGAVGLVISTHNNDVAQAMKQGIATALCLLVLGVGILPAVLQTSYDVWLVLALVIGIGTFVCAALCEDSLGHIARHLEREDGPRRTTAAPPSLPQASTTDSLLRQSVIAYHQEKQDKAARSDNPSNGVELDAWEQWISELASHNAITQREVRVGLRTRPIYFELDPNVPLPGIPLLLWVGIGSFGAALILVSALAALWYVPLIIALMGALVSVATSASATFTREREQQMITQLQLCPMSSLEVVGGKVAATLLLVVRTWGGVLVALCLAALALGPVVSVGSALFVGLLLLWSALLATNLSLLGRHTGIATGGTIGILLVALILIPIAPLTLGIFIPWLQTILTSPFVSLTWLEPMTTLRQTIEGPEFNSFEVGLAFLRLDATLFVLNAVALASATWIWSGARFEESTGGGTRFWERDLTRSWR